MLFRSALPWRYWLFLTLCLSAAPLAMLLPVNMAVMAAFDMAAAVFLISLKPLFSHDEGAIRDRARQNEAKREVMLLITGIVMLVLLVSVWSELAQKDRLTGAAIILVLGTLSLAWLFSNMIYTLHYAYLFYSGDEQGKDCGGLDFPGTQAPDYWDFTYFSFTLGMTFQTSDVEMPGRHMRKVAIFHCLAAFIFNLGIIAFTINVLGGG